jgi:polygalacturonase
MKTSRSVLLVLALVSFSFTLWAKDYNASLFGIKSNGTTLNTTSIQKGIVFVSKNGGGRLVFYVGRYLTGTIHLKSNVTIQLEEGAILVGSVNPFDYEFMSNWTALIFAHDQSNIAITGKGVIDGQGFTVATNLVDLIRNGVIEDPLKYDRPWEGRRPQNIYFNGIDIVDCDSMSVTNSYFDAADDGICLKSHNAGFICQNVYIHNNTIRTSANGIKFGTASLGGFRNITIIKNLVFDTYRSAITFSAVDGGVIENIIVDSLRSINTGNVIFLRIGERQSGKKGKMNNITIYNVYAEVPATKPAAGYNYEGPVEDTWGFYIRHAKGITLENIFMSCGKKDYRTAVVLDDIKGAMISSLKVKEPGIKKENVYSYKCTGVVIDNK